MLERVAILMMIAVAALGLWRLWRYDQARRLLRVAKAGTPLVLAQRLPLGPTVLYFTGEHCAQCRLQQSPILTQLVETLPINLHTVDAVQEEEVASFYGIMTVPSTILLDRTHSPKAINHGLVSLQQLRQQVTELLA
jgi:thiol-disulfide isomerase/thioredoxin